MNYLDLYSSYPDHTIAAAWDSQVKEADKNPWLSAALKQYGDELFARFAACYADLRGLPRGVRQLLTPITMPQRSLTVPPAVARTPLSYRQTRI
jgi:hypothetical protein